MAKDWEFMSRRWANTNPVALPDAKQQSAEWQAAAEALLMAAEDRGPLMHAHVGMMLALHGSKPIPEYNSSKEKYSCNSAFLHPPALMRRQIWRDRCS
jgi:hypothetical protein